MGSLARVVGVVCLLASWSAQADEAAEAKAHYKKGQTHFAVGEFSQAADEFQEAYKVKPDPAFLFNAAQARRHAGENEKALVLYKNYLSLYPNMRNSNEVREQITKLQEAVEAAEKAKTAPPTGTVKPEGEPPPAETTPPPAPAPAPVATPAPAPQSERTPVYKKWWLWTVVGVVVVAAVVIPVAVIEGSHDWTNVPNQGPGAALSGAGLKVQW